MRAFVNKTFKKWSKEKLQEIALLYKTKKEFKQNNPNALQAIQKHGLVNELCAHMPKRIDVSGSNNHEFKYTDEYLKSVAEQYTSMSEFNKEKPLEYQVIRRRKLLNKFCSHMSRFDSIKMENHYKFKWTLEMLQAEALKYHTRTEFARNSDAYDIANRRRLLDKICVHMGKSCNVSRPEAILVDLVKAKFPKAHNMKDKKVKIEGKPHIKGFEIDIYIPELRKGIEFDGIYWHSDSGLKRSREDWPDEDIKNYHSIKDQYFLSKGIEILHIKEEEWIQDQTSCVNKVFEFLGISKDENL